jgi:ubiquinone/menaquinone biosynthesis C-methylase UbiE
LLVSDDSAAPWQNPELAAQLLHNVRGTVPLAIEQIDIMLRLITAARERVGNFLDLGCSDGVLSAAILDEHPGAQGLLLDISEPMLAAARHQLRQHVERVVFRKADFSQSSWTEQIAAEAPFDAVVSGFAIHHVGDQRKQALYGEIFDLLKPEGMFINIEHVSSATRWTQSPLDDYVIDAIFGEQLKHAEGKTRTEIAREYYEQAQPGVKVLAPLEVQCDWLREIGYENVDCYLKVSELAVFGGQKPAA